MPNFYIHNEKQFMKKIITQQKVEQVKLVPSIYKNETKKFQIMVNRYFTTLLFC